MEFRRMVMITLYARQKKRHRCTEQTFGLYGRRWGWDVSREQHVYYLGWNRSPAQVGCMRQVLGPGTLGRPRGMGWRGRWEGGSGWGIDVTPWLIHVNAWQNPPQYCKVISLQLIKINEKKFFFKSPIITIVPEMCCIWSAILRPRIQEKSHLLLLPP